MIINLTNALQRCQERLKGNRRRPAATAGTRVLEGGHYAPSLGAGGGGGSPWRSGRDSCEPTE